MSRRQEAATQAVLLAPVAPPCFEARDQWLEYVASAASAHRQGHLPGPLLVEPGQPVRFNPAFAFCEDCSEQHSFHMHRTGRCQPDYLQRALAKPAAPATQDATS